MSDWPHDKMLHAALLHIRKHAKKEAEWQFTRIDSVPERLARIVRLDPEERPVVSCFIDAQRWYLMTTARVFGIARGAQFDCSPLDVAQWRWGDFKQDDRSGVGTATLALVNGTHLRFSYETGSAAMASIGYGRFWADESNRLGLKGPARPPDPSPYSS